jgi:hypothetical protein
MKFTLGANCHVRLTHTEVNNGETYGFLCQQETGVFPGGVKITHEVDSAGGTRLWIYFDVLLSDHSINPDGSAREGSRAGEYALLMQYMAKQNGLVLDTPVGSFINLGAIGWTADERHTPSSSIVKCQINNAGVYWPAVDTTLLELSLWDGTLTWGSAFWR